MSKEVRIFSDLTDEEKEKMRGKYLQYIPISKIAREHGVKRTTVQYHATTHWSAQRDQLKAEIYSEFNDTKRRDLTDMQQSSVKIMKAALKELLDRDIPPSMREAQQVSAIMDSIDKIMRLDEGTPTDISGEKPMSIEHVEAKLKLNPFRKKVEEVAFTEIEPKKDKTYTNKELVDRVEKAEKKERKNEK